MQTNAAEHIPTALQRRPTVLYLHGNSGDRALPLRVGTYTGFSSRLDVNVFAVDYRGFADSTGSPTVDGVAADARTAWNYLISQGADPKDVLIVGTSLGTAIASILTAELNAENTTPRGLVLLSPFASTTSLMFEYYLFGFLPLLKPLVIMPTLSRRFRFNFRSLQSCSSGPNLAVLRFYDAAAFP
jgi:abhydrolase domain-containing protein 12